MCSGTLLTEMPSICTHTCTPTHPAHISHTYTLTANTTSIENYPKQLLDPSNSTSGTQHVFRLQEIIEKQTELNMGDIFSLFLSSIVLCMQPPSDRVWSSEPLILPRDIRNLTAHGEKTWVGHYDYSHLMLL